MPCGLVESISPVTLKRLFSVPALEDMEGDCACALVQPSAVAIRRRSRLAQTTGAGHRSGPGAGSPHLCK